MCLWGSPPRRGRGLPQHGKLDPRFGSHGVAWLRPACDSEGEGLARDARGRLLVAGAAGGCTGDIDRTPVVLRLSGLGRPDRGLGRVDRQPADLVLEGAYLVGASRECTHGVGVTMTAVTLLLVALLKNSELRSERAIQEKLDALATAMLEERRSGHDEAAPALHRAIGLEDEL